MIRFNVGQVRENGRTENPMFCRKFYILGDDEETILTADLSASPVAMDFKGGKYPTMAFCRNGLGENCAVASLSMDGPCLTFVFEHPPTKAMRVEIDVELYY